MRQVLDAANARGDKLKGNGYGYKQAYKNSPEPHDLRLLHEVLVDTWRNAGCRSTRLPVAALFRTNRFDMRYPPPQMT